MKGFHVFIIHNKASIDITIVIIASIMTALYVNILTSEMLSDPTASKEILQAAKNIGNKNHILVVLFGLILLQVYISRIPTLSFSLVKNRIINEILEAATRSIVYPKSIEEYHMRAIVTIYNKKTKQRDTKYSFNTDPDPEMYASFRVDFGITGKAFKSKSVVIGNLSDGHENAISEKDKEVVRKSVRTVIAAPIIDMRKPNNLPIGVLAFDSIQTIEELGIEEQAVRFVSKKWADILGEIFSAVHEEDLE